MVRKLEDGGFIAERNREVAPANRIRPADPKGDERHDINKNALFRKM
ncbi:hypothetical protein [Sphingomonas oryzagri]